MVEGNDPDLYDDPGAEQRWCAERRAEVAAYLAGEGVTLGTIGEWPAWHVAPYVSVWAIGSLKAPGAVGWWVICGDLQPTTFPRQASFIPETQFVLSPSAGEKRPRSWTESPGIQYPPPCRAHWP
jgi:hypothetical protein